MKTPEGMPFPPFWSMYSPCRTLTTRSPTSSGSAEASFAGHRIPPVGRMQMMKDPQGAAFYIIQPGSSEERPEVRRKSARVMARADDDRRRGRDEVLQRSVRLAAERSDGHGGDGQVPDVQSSARNDRRDDEQAAQMADVPPNWSIYFLVPEINAAVERIKANGGKILNGPMEVPGGDWVVNAMDPQGAAFSLHAKKA